MHPSPKKAASFKTHFSPVFDVFMIATAISAAYPDPIIGLGIQAGQVAVGIGQEIQERYRAARFLTQTNEEFFIPKGLYAMIVTSKTGGGEQADLGAYARCEVWREPTRPIQQLIRKSRECWTRSRRRRSSSGSPVARAHGEAEMRVTCAPLIFPAPDIAAAASPAANEGSTSERIGRNIKAQSRSGSKFRQRLL